MAKPNGYVLYEGPSMLTGAPIAVIATGFAKKSANPKTGAMIQVFIIPADVDPSKAAVDGRDDAVCGDCPLRTKIVDGVRKRACYVQPFQAPRSVYMSYRKGNYPVLSSLSDIADVHAGLAVRLGAWGDPAAVPFEVLQAVVSKAKRHTGYTHQWRTCDTRYRELVMASVDHASEYPTAKANGWRTFRTSTGSDNFAREISCPASAEMGHRTTCEQCGLCNGATADDRRKDIVILAHGSGAKLFDGQYFRVNQ